MATPSCSKLMSAATPSQLRVRLEVGGCGSSRSTPRQLHRQLSRAAFRSPRWQSDAATRSAHAGFRININPCRLDYHRDSASVHLLLMIEVHAVFCRVRLTFKEWPLWREADGHTQTGSRGRQRMSRYPVSNRQGDRKTLSVCSGAGRALAKGYSRNIGYGMSGIFDTE